MRYGDEAQGVAEWLVTTLTNDAGVQAALGVATPAEAALRVWADVAPEDTPYPFVVFQIGDGQDWNPLGPGQRVFVSFACTVRATDKAESYGGISPLAKRFYMLLHGNLNIPVSAGGMILTGQRQQALQYPEQVNGIEYRHIGGHYQIITQ